MSEADTRNPLSILRFVATATVITTTVLTAVDAGGQAFTYEGATPIAFLVTYATVTVATLPIAGIFILVGLFIDRAGRLDDLVEWRDRLFLHGSSWVSPAVACGVFAAMVLFGDPGIEYLGTGALSDYDPRVAFAAWYVISCGVALSAAAGVGLKKPEWRGHRAWLPVGCSAVATYVAFDLVREFIPYDLSPVFLALVTICLASVCIGIPRIAPKTRLAFSGFLGIAVAMIGLAFVSSTATGSVWALQRTTLSFPAASLVRSWVDFDGDRSASLLGVQDCQPFSAEIRPTEFEVPNNGIDDNCLGGDLTGDSSLSRSVLNTGPKKNWNVLLISIDTLRADYVGRKIDGRSLTPNLDALAASGTNFERAYTPSTHTNEALPGMMTGRYPSDWHQHEVYFGLAETLFEMLAREGWKTSAMTSIEHNRPRIFIGFQQADNRLGEHAKSMFTGDRVSAAALAAISEVQGPRSPSPCGFTTSTHTRLGCRRTSFRSGSVTGRKVQRPATCTRCIAPTSPWADCCKDFEKMVCSRTRSSWSHPTMARVWGSTASTLTTSRHMSTSCVCRSS